MVLASLCLGVLTLVNFISAPKIRRNQALATVSLIKPLVPKAMQAKLQVADVQQLLNHHYLRLESGSPPKGQSSIELYLTTASGYAGPIMVITSYAITDNKYVLVGAQVIPPQQETPGLGDVILATESDWITQFSDTVITTKPLNDDLHIDTVTGATISTRAVILAVRKSMKLALGSVND